MLDINLKPIHNNQFDLTSPNKTRGCKPDNIILQIYIFNNNNNANKMTLLQDDTNSSAQKQSESIMLAKLQDMVPSMRQEKDLSKLEILNNAIDYIRQLKEQAVVDD